MGQLHPVHGYIVSVRYSVDGGKFQKVPKYGTLREDATVLALYGGTLEEIPLYGKRFGVLPPGAIEKVFDPIEFAMDVLDGAGPGEKQTDICGELLQSLYAILRLPSRSLGVGGSLLLGLARTDSDIDLHVYGEASSSLVTEALTKDCAEFQLMPVNAPESTMLRQFASLGTPSQAGLRSSYSFWYRGTKVDFHHIPSVRPVSLGTLPTITVRSELRRFVARVLDSRLGRYFPGFVLVADSATGERVHVLFLDKSFHFVRPGQVIQYSGREMVTSPFRVFGAEIQNLHVAQDLVRWKAG